MSAFKERAGQYLREGPGGVNLEKIGVYVGLGIALWIAYKSFRVGKVAYDAARMGVANTIEWFFPLDIGEMTYYTVTFPDGSKHAIGSRSFSSDGTLRVPSVDIKTGKPTNDVVNTIPALRGKYRVQKDKSIVAGPNLFAVKV